MNNDIEKIRSFNRYYTNIIGLLDDHILNSPYSLIEARILYEIYNTDSCTAKKIRKQISIDEGYLSRIIDRFVKTKLIEKNRSGEDGRSNIITLTRKGTTEFLKLNSESEKSTQKLIENLSNKDRTELIRMMEKIQQLISKQ